MPAGALTASLPNGPKIAQRAGMQHALQITFHGTEASEAVAARIHEQAEQLGRLAHHITSFRVTVETPHTSKHRSNQYCVRLDIQMPGQGLIVSHSSAQDRCSHENLYVAVRDAFATARRQLESYADRRNHHPERHEMQEGDLADTFGYGM